MELFPPVSADLSIESGKLEQLLRNEALLDALKRGQPRMRLLLVTHSRGYSHSFLFLEKAVFWLLALGYGTTVLLLSLMLLSLFWLCF